jgi:imidazolonepropionase-like amidohydrolase
MSIRAGILALAVILIVLTTPRPALAQASDSAIAITNATVHVEPGTVIHDATIVIRGGVVRQVGKGVAAPQGARIIDGKDKVVTAGLIEADTQLGLVEVSLEHTTREGVFGSGTGDDAIHAAYRVVDGYNPNSVAIPVARSEGITSAVAVPHGGLISGTSGWFSLARSGPGNTAARAPLAMYASLGEAALSNAQGSRGLALMRLREALDDARQYNRQRRSYERNQSRAFAASRLDLEALVPVVQGRMPLIIRVNRASDILAAIGLGKELGVRVIIAGGVEAWMVASELAAASVGVIMNPEHNMPSSFDSVHVRDDNATALANAGVDVVISTMGSASSASGLRQLAGMAVANGMSHAQALAAVTTAPARLLGVDRGAIKTGAVADLVVWSGDPFELSSRAEHVIIGGAEQSTRNRQDELFERYRTLPAPAKQIN